jgi:phosphoglycolate phosphatase
MTSTKAISTLATSIECVLFDLDGTLIDTAPDFFNVVNKLLRENDKAQISEQAIYQTVSDGARALVKLAFQIEADHENFASLNQRLLDLYDEELNTTAATLYPGISELLDELERTGVHWGIVTNKPEKYTLKLLSNLNLLPRCKCVVCPDHVEHSKPHPEPIFLAMAKFNANSERTVYIGDHVRDIQCAKNADVMAIAAAYGYIAPDNLPEQWYADFIVRESDQIIPLLNLLKFA